MYLDTIVMSALMLFVFIGYAVYAFYMFFVPFKEEHRLFPDKDRFINVFDYDDPSLQ
jgi:hypothetical protein